MRVANPPNCSLSALLPLETSDFNASNASFAAPKFLASPPISPVKEVINLATAAPSSRTAS